MDVVLIFLYIKGIQDKNRPFISTQIGRKDLDGRALIGQLSKIHPYRIKRKSKMFYYITD